MTMTADNLLLPVTRLQTNAQPAETSFAHRVLMTATGIQISLLIPSIIGLLIDERQINDISVWIKPLKFQTSLMMLLVTLVLLLPLIEPIKRAGRTVRWWSVVAATTATGEIAYITLQSARGRASHFNLATPLESAMYSVMGVGAVLLVLSCLAIGWTIWRHGNDRVSPGLRLGGAVGLMLGAVLTLMTAGYLGSAASHWVGGVTSDANGLFLVGWSRTGGDLRVPHFFATHVMQALPILGLILDRSNPQLVRPGLLAGAVLSLLVVAGTFAQALMGLPFIG